MKRVPRLAALLPLFLLPPADPAAAQLSELYDDWASGPASHLFTEEDREAWKKVDNDPDAEAFVKLFWARRDPDRSTPENEFRHEFERRVSFTDGRFGTEKDRGCMTERGATFILFGPPRRLQSPGASGLQKGGALGTGDVAFDPGSQRTRDGNRMGSGAALDRKGVASEERWIYEKESLPSFVNKRRWTVRFHTVPGSDEVHFAQPAEILPFLRSARRASIANSDLGLGDLDLAPAGTGAAAGGALGFSAWQATRVDDDGLLAGLASRLSADGDDGSGLHADLETGAFQASDGTWIVPFQVAIPEADPRRGQARIVGEILGEGGERKLAFELAKSWQYGKGQSYVRETLLAPPGKYELRAGLVGTDGEVTWAARSQVEVPSSPAGLWLSPVVLSDNIFPMSQAQQMLEPYAWQGIAVVPKAGRSFRQGELLWYYVHACNVSLTDTGKPDIRLITEVRGPTRFRGSVSLQPTKAGDQCWVLAQGLDLAAERFPAGDYEIELSVVDRATEERRKRSRTFSVGASSP